MGKVPNWAVATGGIVILAFALLGIFNSTHTGAKVLYSILIVLSVAALGVAARRARASSSKAR
jgi:RsiW-degrading membrane proteinase PrsW (M82 family)